MKFNKKLDKIANYKAGKPIEEVVRRFGIIEDKIIKLASNENPYGTSKKVIQAIQQNAHKASLYPDDSMIELKSALAKKFHLGVENFIIGSGSDQIIEFCLGAKANEASKILMAGTTFAMYEIYAKHVGAQIIKTKSPTHSIAEFKQYYAEYKPDVVFLCVPNNPLGECLDSSEVFDFISDVDKNTLVVIDGAYQEFATYKDKNKAIAPKELISRFSNALYLGTFSKAYGLGGMRIGYGIASKEIISTLHKIRPPFNISTLSLIAALKALEDEDFVKMTISHNFQEMVLFEHFAESKNIDFIPSYTNFITFLFDEKQDSSTLCEALLQKGVIVRNLKSYGMNAMRITIGTNTQNIKVLRLLESLIG